jgi:intergrase/recombinase
MEMVQEPAFIRECLFEVLISYELVINVGNEFEKKTPTSKKLISSLECDESESDFFKNLKRYVREIDMDTKMMRTLLRFLTASDLMLYNSEEKVFKIQFKIVDLEGIARRPVAHPCGRVLDLPRMYE